MCIINVVLSQFTLTFDSGCIHQGILLFICLPLKRACCNLIKKVRVKKIELTTSF